MTKSKKAVLTISKKGVTVSPQKIPKVQVGVMNSPSLTKKKKKKKISFVTGVEGSLASEGGQMQEVEAHALAVKEKMMGTSLLTEGGKSSVMTILNPCGELGSDENAKFPDGTLSQSGIQRFRQFETITSPWQSISSSSNVTNNWSLYIISPASFRTIAIFIATRDARSLGDQEFAEVFTALNNLVGREVPNYPAWSPLGFSSTSPPVDPNIYFSVYSFKSANLDIDPTSGESKTIESFRIVGDGMVVMHNTPDLWNQGSFAVGQFTTDFEVTQTDTTVLPIVVSLRYANLNASNAQATVSVSYLDTVTGDVIYLLDPTIQNFTPGLPTITIPFPTGTPLAFQLLAQSPDNREFANYTGTAGNITFTQTFGGTPVMNVSTDLTASTFQLVIDTPYNPSPGPQGALYSGLLGGVGANFSGDGGFYNPSQVIWSLPALNQDSIAQADPKFSAELMKAHCGFYAVRRYFEPKLRMTRSNSGGAIKMETLGMNKQDVINAPGGILNDILDVNGATMVAMIKGISYACSPTIKSVRFVEFMPASNSALAPFVGPTPPKDEDAEEIFRQMQLEGPHSYIPDANFLGFLASFVMRVVEATPVFLRTARSVSESVIKAIDWAETKLKAFS